jgi:glutathione S-transferase
LVPALEYQGKSLYESLILCEFLEDAYPSHALKLLPTDPYTRAYCRLWIDHVSKSIVPCGLRLLQAQEKEKQEACLQELYESLKKVAKEIKGPWFLGEQFSLVDVVIAPVVVRDFIPTQHRGYKRENVGPGWKDYADRLEKRESILNTTSVGRSLTLLLRNIDSDENLA